jgi:outer membrane receptor protein involved in Fe transport
VLVDFSTGFDIANFKVDLYLNNAFDERAILARSTECAITVCGGLPYDTPSQPRTAGLKVSHDF